MLDNLYSIIPIGVIRSELTNLAAAPRQGDEGAPDAWLEIAADVAEGLVGLAVGDELVVLTWLHRAQRDVLMVGCLRPDHPTALIRSAYIGFWWWKSLVNGCASPRLKPLTARRLSILSLS